MRFKCAFDTTATTDAHDITVSVTSLGEQEIEETGLTWDSVELKFYSDSNYGSVIESTELHEIGDTVNAEVSWTDGVSSDFPVSFYLKECSVKGSRQKNSPSHIFSTNRNPNFNTTFFVPEFL